MDNIQEKNSSTEAYNDSKERIHKLQMKSDSIARLLKKIDKEPVDEIIKAGDKETVKRSLKITRHAASLLSLTKAECHQASTAELIEKLRKEKTISDAMAREILSKIILLTDNLLQLSTGK